MKIKDFQDAKKGKPFLCRKKEIIDF